MIVVGLTGGIASGKSTVARMLQQRGAAIIDSDEIAREVTAPGTPALDEIVRAFGPDLLTPEGTLDRKRLGALVFSDPERRRQLERITHPHIRAEMRQRLERLRRGANPPVVAVVVIPLLYETGAEAEVDVVVVAAARGEDQVRRLMARDCLTREQAEARVAAQMRIAEKAERADFVLDTSAGLEETARQVANLMRRLAGGSNGVLA
jgi:dephospho-CoA kinase